MKQQVILIGLVFAMLSAFSQTNNGATTTTATATPVADSAKAKNYCPHRIWVDFGMAYSNNIYRRFDNIQQVYSFGNVLEAGYAYFFHPKMGVGLGVGISKITAKATLGNGGSILYKDPEYLPGDTSGMYELFFDCDKFAERQDIWAIEVPLTFQFETKLGKAQRNGIFASLGVKGYFPISGRTNFVGGDIQLSGYDEFLNCRYPIGMPVHFEDVNMGSKYASVKLRPSVDLIADFGGLFGLTKTTDFYLGIYGAYGFLDILPKEKVDYIQDKYTVSGLLKSNALEIQKEKRDENISTKWNLVNAGIKVGLRFKPCGQRAQSFREDKRDFLDKFEDRLNKAAEKGKGDGKKDDGKKGEPVHIIPIYMGNPNGSPYGDGNDGDGTRRSKNPDDIGMEPGAKDLMDALTNAQIYFPLDKDIPINPKLAQREVDKAAAILKKYPDLKIILDGYTCRLGTQAHNEDLGHRRAITIRNMFIAKGVNPQQIEIENFTVENYPKEVISSFQTLEDARTVIFKIGKR